MAASRPVVHLTQHASLQGKVVCARNSTKPINAFLGIPFAAPPVGAKRFMPPEPAQLWQGMRDATEHGPICYQDLAAASAVHYPFQVPQNMSDDCLYLNVYMPTISSSKKLPVMLWIHGGSFIQGFSNFYEGTALCTFHDIIFVSINYRLGPFGYLCTGDDIVKGNAGMLDQIEALKWVQKYISCFNGDPDNVTIFGESAGSLSVNLLLLSELSRGLYKRAICQSGAATYPGLVWTPSNAGKYIRAHAKKMGCEATNSEDLVKFLQAQPGEALVEGLGVGFTPVLDGHFLKGMPLDLYQTGSFNPADLMVGFNSTEGTQFVFGMLQSKEITDRAVAEWAVKMVVTKMTHRHSNNQQKVIELIRGFYVQGVPTEQLMENIVAMYGEMLFVAPSVDIADMHSSRGRTYMYYFDQRLSRRRDPEWVRADHGDEIPMVMGEPFLTRFPNVWRDEQRTLSKQIMSYWTNFAINGDPNGTDLPRWPQHDSHRKAYLKLQFQPHSQENFQPDKMSFWNRTVKNADKSAAKL